MSDRASEHEHDAAPAREGASAQGAATAALFSPTTAAQILVGLQRTAGNRAVTRLVLQRQGAAATTAPAMGEAARPEVESLLKAFHAAGDFDKKNALAMQAVRAVIRAFGLSTRGVYHMRFEPDMSKHDAETLYVGDPDRQSRIRFGPGSFGQGFEWLVHIVAHELEHVRQNLIGAGYEGGGYEGAEEDPPSEFVAYAGSVLQVGTTLGRQGHGSIFKGMGPESDKLPALPALPPARLADQASRAMKNWRLLHNEDRRKFWGDFEGVRDKLLERIDNEAPQALRPPSARSGPDWERWVKGQPPSTDPFSPEYQAWSEAVRGPWVLVKEVWKQFNAVGKP